MGVSASSVEAWQMVLKTRQFIEEYSLQGILEKVQEKDTNRVWELKAKLCSLNELNNT